ncbi:Uncharacterized protein HZ326_0645 [Fusarium oxysporum f. sp. albedinis]|nr:Uncharacterized protein HZ326_0645 [Fusarium oxysporum f. sp. albedinis]
MMRSNRDWDHGSLINRSGLGGNEPVTVTQQLGQWSPDMLALKFPHIPRSFSSLGASLIAVDSGQGAV